MMMPDKGNSKSYSYRTITIVLYPVTCSNFTCDIKPHYLLIVENYPHLMRRAMCVNKKQSALK